MSAAADALLAVTSPEEIIAKCLSLGLVVRRAPAYDITHPALTLQPTTVRAASFASVVALQRTWNTLMDRCARDPAFVNCHLADTAASDTGFVGRLLGMYNEIYCTGGAAQVHQPLMLGVFRADYMRDSSASSTTAEASAPLVQEWKNVEINTISVSFAALSTRVGELHGCFRQLQQAEAARGPSAAPEGQIVVSESLRKVPAALLAAHSAFLDRGFGSAPAAAALVPAVVFVIQEQERNTGDQYLLAFQLLETGGVRSIRRTMTQLDASMVLVPDDRAAPNDTTSSTGAGARRRQAPTGTGRPPLAVIDGKYLATVFYLRSTYVPTDFISEGCWAARRAMELSSAVKCPSLPYHLLTTKKLQQVLSNRAVLATFLSDVGEAAIDALFASFVGQHALNHDTPATQAVIQDAIANPGKYVLKPQLEGGGNLFAGAKMVAQLQATEASDPATFARVRQEYILMERIRFDITSGAMLRFGEVVPLINNMCCELGIFGTILADGAVEVLNDEAGYVVRSKPADVDDGGVMAGVAALDCVSLV